MSLSLAQKDVLARPLTFSPAMREATRYMRWVMSSFQPYIGASVLEIGIGHGGYRAFLPPASAYAGLDIDAALVEEARQNYSDGLYIHADAADASLPALLAGHPVDTILCVNVLEHIAEDRKVVANLLALLPPRGRLLIFVPAFQGLYSNLDRHAGHFRRYRLKDLTALVPQGRAKIIKAHYFNALGAAGWWVNKWVNHAALDAPGINNQLKLFDRFFVPLARLLDSLCMRAIGQSAVCVIEKL